MSEKKKKESMHIQTGDGDGVQIDPRYFSLPPRDRAIVDALIRRLLAEQEANGADAFRRKGGDE